MGLDWGQTECGPLVTVVIGTHFEILNKISIFKGDLVIVIFTWTSWKCNLVIIIMKILENYQFTDKFKLCRQSKTYSVEHP